MELIKKQTSLEKIDQSIKETLDWKSKQLQDGNLPVESGLADYIAFGVSNIDDEVKQLTEYKKMIDSKIKALKEHKTLVQEECAEWFNENGIDKLKGISCSSITINKGKEETTKDIELVAYKYTDKKGNDCFGNLDELLMALLDDGVIEELVAKDTAIVPATKDKIKINAKRK